MKINYLRDGTVEIKAGEIPFQALLRCIRRIPGAVVIDASHNWMNDDARIEVRYRDIAISVFTPFSDFIIDYKPSSGGEAFGEFMGKLSKYKMKWWERFF